ncbi:HTH_38 domain-containing protein [Trichonephila clavipes]|nr:HTH_38 domain-containing protein [Trichonephila clavipes]
MTVTDRSVTSRTVAQHIESVTHHSVFARTIRRVLQQSGPSERRPLLDFPLTQNHNVSTDKGVMKEAFGLQNGMKLALLTSHSCVCNTKIFGFESGVYSWTEDADELCYAPPHWSCTVYYGMEWDWISLSHSSSTH